MTDGVTQRRTGVRGWIVWPILILVVASFVYVGVKVPQHTQISPFDEYVYLDYLAKVPTEGVVRENEKTGDFARNEISCRGVLDYGSFGQKCDQGAHRDDVKYPYGGYGGADIYSPVYFAVTWVVAQPLTWFGVDLLDAGRLAGALWLAGGLVLTLLLMRRLGVPSPLALGISLLILATPTVYWADTYLSTDAPSLFVAAGVGLLAVLAVQRRASAWWLLPASVIGVLLKVQNLGAVGLACLALVVYQVVRHIADGDRERRPVARAWDARRDRIVWAAILAVVAGVVAQLVWLFVRSRIALPASQPLTITLDIQHLTPAALVDESLKFLFNIGATDLATGATGAIAFHLLTAAGIAGIIGLIIGGGRRPAVHHQVIAVSTVAIALLLGPALAISSKIVAGYYFPLPLRYGIVLLPAFALCGALFLATARRTKWPVFGLGVLAAVAVIAF